MRGLKVMKLERMNSLCSSIKEAATGQLVQTTGPHNKKVRHTYLNKTFASTKTNLKLTRMLKIYAQVLKLPTPLKEINWNR